MPQVGSFQLHERVGRGASGEVWRATHLGSGAPAAVKVLVSRELANHAFTDAFRREVRAVAGLSHPAVVDVYDFGALPADSVGPAGSPYLVMEYAEEGTLDAQMGRIGYRALRQVLLDLLGALAHVHARGLLHLDIKPSNVLRTPAIRLADFGIALWSDEEVGPVGITGTPAYMAPEQIWGQWRDYGPWTDLYALGGLAWAMISGEPPRKTASRGDALEPAPALSNSPDGFLAWISRLLDPEPSRRFARASEAASALRALPVEGPAASTAPSRSPVAQLFETVPWLPNETPPAAWPEAALPLVAAADPVMLPHDWRQDQGAPTVQALHGVGLGLYGLRAVPFIGREPERDALWGALTASLTDRVARVVRVEGQAGMGKSRLAEWLAHRAHEAGAIVLTARHGDPAGPRDGLAAMIERHHAARQLDRASIAARVVRGAALPYAVALVITEMIRPRASNEAPLSGEGPPPSPETRIQAVCTWIEALAARRPVVLWLDDAQWGLDACRLAAALEGRAVPVVVLLTVRTEVLPTQPEHAGLLASLSALRVRLEGLDAEERRALVHSLLGLTGELAARVEDRSAGNPLFAVQLVGDWVARGVLELRDGGFDVAPGATADVPDAIHTLWMRRVGELLGGRPEALIPLELAAVLGATVDLGEWRAACAAAATAFSDELVGELRDRGLAVDADAGSLRFTHGLLAESLVRSAREGGRLHDLSLHAGRALYTISRSHLVAGRNRICLQILERALPLLSADFKAWGVAMASWLTTRRMFGEDTFRETEQLLARAEAEGDTQVQTMMHRSLGLAEQDRGNLAGAKRHLERAQEIARRDGDLRNQGLAASNLAGLEVSKGRFDLAVRGYDEALDLRRRAGDAQGVAVMTGNLGIVLQMWGRWDEAELQLRRALDLSRDEGMTKNEAFVLAGLAHVAEGRGHLLAAREAGEEARALFLRVGDVSEESTVLSVLARLARRAGDPVGAVKLATEALTVAEKTAARDALALPEKVKAILELGRAFRAMGDGAGASACFTRARDAVLRGGLPLVQDAAIAEVAWYAIERGELETARVEIEAELARRPDGLKDQSVGGAVYAVAAALYHRLGDDERGRTYSREAITRRALIDPEIIALLLDTAVACGAITAAEREVFARAGPPELTRAAARPCAGPWDQPE